MNELETIKKFTLKSQTTIGDLSKKRIEVVKSDDKEPALIIRTLVLCSNINTVIYSYVNFEVLKTFKDKYLLMSISSMKLSTFNKIYSEVKDIRINGKKEITIEHIQDVVCKYYNLTLEQLHTETRKREIVQARQIAQYFAKQLTKVKLEVIGEKIGNKNHSTISHASKVVNNLIDTDKEIKAQIKEIERKIKE
jgi:hypothetical protein